LRDDLILTSPIGLRRRVHKSTGHHIIKTTNKPDLSAAWTQTAGSRLRHDDVAIKYSLLGTDYDAISGTK